MKIWQRIKHWYWWNFQACEHDKAALDAMIYGTSIIDEKGKRVPPEKFWKKPGGEVK